MAYKKTNYINDDYPALNADNLNKTEQAIINNTLWKEATCNVDSDYELQIENWETENNSFLAIKFNDSIDGSKQASLKINDEEIRNLTKQNGDIITGDTISSKIVLLMASDNNWIVFSSDSDTSALNSLPKDTILMYKGENLPHGYAWCDGKDGRPLSIFNGVTDIETGKETFLGYKTDGKWTYCKKVAFGALPNNVSKKVNHGLSNVTFLRYESLSYIDNDIISLPFVTPYNSTYSIQCTLTNTQINIMTNRDMSTFLSTYVYIYYTKNNDAFKPQYNIIKVKEATDNAVTVSGKEIGEVGYTYLNTAPHNCLFIENKNYSKIDYPELWQKAKLEIESGINTLFINVDDNNFKIKPPQFLVSYLQGDSDFGELGKQGGEKKHKLTVDEMPTHLHAINYTTDSTTFGNGYIAAGSSFNVKTTATDTVGGSQPHNNLPPYTVARAWICYKTSPYTENMNNLDNKVQELENKSIYDSGSNENGSWIKFNDGSMICHGIKAISGVTYDDYYNFCNKGNRQEVLFPQTFISAPSVSLEIQSFGVFSHVFDATTQTLFRYYPLVAKNVGTAPGYTFLFTAIGKWK